MSRYYIGQVARIRGKATIKELDGTTKPADPTKVIGTLIRPDGKDSEIEADRVVSGEYVFEIPQDEAGKWELIVDGIGGADTANHIKWTTDPRTKPRPSG
jgi:hypothetical protein